MQVTITEPVFLWYFGITATLLVLILLLFAIGLVFFVRLMKLVTEKAIEAGETVDIVQDTVRHTAQSFDEAREKVAQIFNVSATASSVASVIRSVKNAWQGTGNRQQNHDDDVESAFDNVNIKHGKDS